MMVSGDEAEHRRNWDRISARDGEKITAKFEPKMSDKGFLTQIALPLCRICSGFNTCSAYKVRTRCSKSQHAVENATP